MSKFNTKQTTQKSLKRHPSATKNHEGGLAFAMDAKTELTTRVLTCFMEPKFYSTTGEVVNELSGSVDKVLNVDPEYVLKLAAYARNEFNMRSVPLFLLNKYANSGATVLNSRKYVSACIKRPDEITELLALSIKSRLVSKLGYRPYSMFIREGLKPAFNKFDAYQYGKYDREGEVTLKDALFLCHPVPKDYKQQEIFDNIASESLETPETWETYIAANGSSKENWEYILPKMGYMAVLRNLSNFLKHNVNIKIVVDRLTDPVAVKKSKQFPFRFFSAYKVLKDTYYGENVSRLLKALEDAMKISVENVPKIPGKSLILVDVSGSMSWSTISKKSKMTPEDIASLFGAISSEVCENAHVIAFADEFGVVKFSETDTILKKASKIVAANVGSGTYAHLPMNFARARKIEYDRVLLFSDMQCYASDNYNDSFAREFILYQREVNPKVALYSFDLTGNGTAVIPEDNKNVMLLGGFSEKLFSFIPQLEGNRSSLIKTIESYKV